MLFTKNKKKQKKEAKKFYGNFGSSEEKVYLIDNLTMLLGSGMDISLALKAVKSELKSISLKRAIDDIGEDVNNGTPLWRAFENVGIFPGYVVSLVRIGEESGKLSQNLKIIAAQQEKDKTFKSKIRSAMLYPSLVVFLTIFIGTGIAWFILPKLSTVFDSLNLELPLITKILIKIGGFLAQYGVYAIPTFLFSITVIFYIVFIFNKTKFIGQRILFSLPAIKNLIKQIEISRFGYVLGTLLEAGMPIIDSLKSLSRATEFKMYGNLYLKLGEDLNEGNSFGKIFSKNKKMEKLISPTVQQMLISGEGSGNLSATLLRIGKNYEEKMETTTKNLSVILEPILLVIVWMGVVFVALAVILPIYSLIGGLNDSKNKPVNKPVSQPIESVTFLEKKAPIEAESSANEKKLKILQTELNYLNVRENPTTASKIVGRANSEEEYPYNEKKDGWYKISISEEISGWVSGDYVEEINMLEEAEGADEAGSN